MDGGLISGLIGAIIGGLFTLWGTMIDGRRQQRESDEEVKKNKSNILMGIKVEITTLLDIYNSRIADAIQSYDGTEPFNHIFPIVQNNFLFYEKNGIALSAVSEETFKSIVRFYASARSLVDTYLMNNFIIEELSRREILFNETNKDVHKDSWGDQYQLAIEYGMGLKAIHNEVMDRVNDCLPKIRNEIERINAPEGISNTKKILRFLALIK